MLRPRALKIPAKAWKGAVKRAGEIRTPWSRSAESYCLARVSGAKAGRGNSNGSLNSKAHDFEFM
jgi:uncharacterized lipoprotein